MKNYCLLLVLALVCAWSLPGQQNPPPGRTRPGQDDLLFEKQFVEAMREKVRGDHEKAIQSFEDLLRKDKSSHAVCFELAKLYRTTKRFDKALEKARQAHTLAPDNIFYGVLCADLLEAEGRYAESATVFETLAKRHPAVDSLNFRLANDQRRANKPDLALKTYARIEARIGPTPEVTREKVALLEQMGKANKVPAEWEALLAVFPGEPEYYEALAKFYEKNGAQDKAIGVYERLLAAIPGDPRANLRMAEHYKARGEEEKYLQTLGRLIPDPALSLEEKTKALAPYAANARQISDPARKSLLFEMGKTLAETYPDDAAALALYGDFAQASGKWPLAATAYRSACKAAPNKLENWKNALACSAALGSWKEMESAAAELSELFPNDPNGPYFLGLAAVHLGRPADAQPLLQDAIRMSGSQPALKADALAAQGLALALQKQFAKSDESFEKSRSAQPESGYALLAHSMALLLRGDQNDRALETALKAVAQQPDNPLFVAQKARALYRKLDFAGAKTVLEKALPLGGDQDPATLELYGDALSKLGQTDAALDNWRKALEKNPGSATLTKKIAARKVED